MALQVKRCTEETRKNSDVVLENGQPLYTTDTHKLFIGDGTTPINELVGTEIGLNIENGIGKHSLVQIPLQYGLNEDGSLKYGNVASGSDAIALGISSQAINSRAVAIGNSCISGANTAFTIGQTNKNYANGSFTFGNGNIAGTLSYDADGTTLIAGNDSGSQYSIVGGLKNNHRGQQCITVGEENTVESNSSGSTRATITAGLKNIVKDAIASAIFGNGNTVDGSSLQNGASNNIVAGTQNILKSDYSAVFGLRNEINHPDGSGHSFVVGVDNYTQADATFLLGRGLYSTNGNQVVVGKYNDYYNNNSIFIVGNGSDSSDRSNAFEVRNSGEIKSSGVVTSKGIRTVDGGIFVGATIDENNSTTTSTIALNKDGSARFSGEITSPTITNITSTIQSLGQTKADKATTLSGYGITNAYTQTEIDDKDTVTLTSAKSYTDTKVQSLDAEITCSPNETITSLSQVDGKISGTASPVMIPKHSSGTRESDNIKNWSGDGDVMALHITSYNKPFNQPNNAQYYYKIYGMDSGQAAIPLYSGFIVLPTSISGTQADGVRRSIDITNLCSLRSEIPFESSKIRIVLNYYSYMDAFEGDIYFHYNGYTSYNYLCVDLNAIFGDVNLLGIY